MPAKGDGITKREDGRYMKDGVEAMLAYDGLECGCRAEVALDRGQ